MFGTSNPNLIVAGLGVGFLFLARLWRFILWVRESPQNNGNIQHRNPINREQASHVKWIAWEGKAKGPIGVASCTPDEC